MPVWLLALRASLTSLTRLPVGGFPYPKKPGNGFRFGFLWSGCSLERSKLNLAGAWRSFGPTRASIAVAFGVIVTGGFHEDGLADSADVAARLRPGICSTHT